MDYEGLIVKAAQAKENAYAPYSGFRVGAAVLTKEGKVFTGCNIENASYSLAVCAERTALFKAISEGYQDIKAVALSTDTKDITSPCGACRQVIFEFGDDIDIIMANVKGENEILKIKDLLPLAFGPAKLEEELLR